MNKIKFLGASGMVTGSCYFLSDESDRGIIIDMGMFQGTKEEVEQNFEDLDVDFRQVDGVILTHAHLDHCGRLPLLYRGGYTGKIYMTKATRKLTELTLRDAAKIAREETIEHPPLYTEDDVRALLNQMTSVAYHKEFKIGDYSITLVDAGHLLGSASVIIRDIDQTIVFSGDIGNYPSNILKKTELIGSADVVVMETTYGDREHGDEDASDVLASEINEIERTGGTLLIPAFSLERTQELLHRLNHLKSEDRIKESTAVFVDGPMAIRATRIYKQFRNLYNDEMFRHARQEDPYSFPGMKMTERSRESRDISDYLGPKVIIAGSGMMTGGRILRHAQEHLPNPKTRLLIVGYQGEETLGREIEEGAKEVYINDELVQINATINKTGSMSTHAGQSQLLEWLKNIEGVKKVFLTHGDEEPRKAFRELIMKELKMNNVELPLVNQEFSL
ncbi:MAG TPA: MBL fold metallo-hydrolase [Candidatus Nitrosocosmicus sp.]|nr:MBL fold metallo-hydrolase [Candidatus Nitrosocosmicus sp.]